jgi:hypothetical protein
VLRQIIEDTDVSDAIDKARRVSPRVREAWDGLTWLLARNAEIGYQLGLGENVRLHKQLGYPRSNIPTITVLYEYDEHSVEIRSVKFDWE